MRRLCLLAALALAACGSSDPMAAYKYGGPQAPASVAGQAPASAAEIERLVTGNTLVAVTRDGARWTRLMKPHGYFTSYNFPPNAGGGKQWRFLRGVWHADDGRLCFRPEEARQDNCLKVIAGPGVLHAYNEKDGAWQFSAELRPDNPFEL